jgi:shikimate kinase
MKIFLIGFMGSGKTYWGKIWAKENELDFFDLDHLIEQQEQKSIAAIFETSGEEYFRKKEAAVLRTFEEKDNCIISCGGGTACFHNNMQWMNADGKTIYLAATAAEIFERVAVEQDQRPLIKNLGKDQLLFFIEQKLKEREPVYTQARIILRTDELNTDSLKRIINS